MITIEQESLRAEAEPTGHCDQEKEESGQAPQREVSLSGEMEPVLYFPFLTFANRI